MHECRAAYCKTSKSKGLSGDLESGEPFHSNRAKWRVRGTVHRNGVAREYDLRAREPLLMAYAKALYQRLIPLRITILEILDQLPAPLYHRQQPTPRVMVLLVRLEVFR